MISALDLLRTRRSIPAALLGEPGPTAEQRDALLTMAVRVPDHGKLAPWRFILFEGEARREASAALTALRLSREPGLDAVQAEQERTRFLRAPLVVAVVSRAAPHAKYPEWEQILSSGALTMNLIIAVHAMGFAANWLTDWPIYDPDAKAILGVAPDERLAGFVYIGTPTVPPIERPRPDLAKVVTHWQSSADWRATPKASDAG